MENIIIGVSLTTLPLILFLYGYTALKLRWRLEEKHGEFVSGSDFPKKESDYCYTSTPKTGGSWLRFVFSDNDLNDPVVTRLKAVNKAVIYGAGIWVVFFVVAMLWLAGTANG